MHVVGAPARATRRLTHAQGADRTGLGRLIELTAAHSAGDALVTVALAGALLFRLPVGQARGQVAAYLLVTMLPFTVVAPFVGPVLDRLRSGRRYIMAGTLLARGLLCWGMAGAVHTSDAVTLFPSALAVLVLSKAYNVSRAAIMPSLLPADIPLVTANARVALFALVSAGAGAGLATGLSAAAGPDWVLRAAVPVFLLCGVFAVRLPRHVDAPDPEDDEPRPRWRTLLGLRPEANPGAGPDTGPDTGAGAGAGAGRAAHPGAGPGVGSVVGSVVGEAMGANAAIRVQSGFLVFFLLFLVQDGHLRGLDPTVALALLAAAAGAGGLAGAAAGSWTRSRSPQLTVLATLALATVATVAAAFVFTIWTAAAVALVGAFAQGLGKLAFDAIVQREIGEEVRSSAFGVAETLLQIAWVSGGLLGLVLSLFVAGPAGLGVMSAALALSFGRLLTLRRRRLAARPATA
ncbi:MFS transporter [Microbispora amethystogenes]|uniref:MFS transporter n=1 Tax=Microbispora amethystogenes TaxID=1427754 RepID=A0ABQ4FJQ3_9ACTN|nr:MFS transporter [Microbispora amethystogenes]GIH35059.1 MFS transporter [Microbispora amethystogenes]